MEWISVKDERPNIGRIVNLSLKHTSRDVYAGFRAKGGRYCFVVGEDSKRYVPDGIKGVDITHWMPLPEPPKQ